MKNKHIAGAVSLFIPVFLVAFSFISIIPAQRAFADVAVACPIGYICTSPVHSSSSDYSNHSSSDYGTPASCFVFTTNMTVGSTGAQVVALQTFLISNGYLTIQGGPSGYFGADTKAAVYAYQTATGLPATGFVGPLTLGKLNGSCGAATIKLIGSPTLALSYNSAQKEAALTSTFTFSVNGGARGINILQNTAYATLVDQNGQGWSGATMSGSFKPMSPSVATTSDNYGQTYYVVPAGHNVTFQVIDSAYPQQMFAGTYHASFINVGTNLTNNVNGVYSLAAPSNSSNSVTIVGELSPYITSVTSPVSAGQAVTISGQRLTGSILIDGTVVGNPTVGNGTSLSFTLPASIAPGQHFVTVSNASTGLSNQAAIQVIGSSSQATVALNSSPTLVLSYNSSQKESGLTATFNTTVTAGTSDLYLATGQADVALFDQNNKAVSANSMQIQVNVAAGEKTDQYGRDYTIVAAGHTVQLGVILSVNPGELFAGTYHASLLHLYTNPLDPQGIYTSIPVTSNQTNSVTIVGELSPYISSVTSPVSAGQTVTIRGQHLSGTILIDAAPVTNANIIPSTDGTSLSFTLPSSITTGTNWLAVNSATTGGSNQVSFQVTGSSSALPPVINGGTFPTTLTVGQTGTWVVNASDPQNGSLSYSVNWGDTSTCPVGYVCTNTNPIIQSSSFTHSYAAAGTYTVTFTVTNSAGLSAKTSTTVTVTPSVVTPVIGSVAASIDASSPLSSTLQSGQSNVTLAVIDLKAGGTPVTNLAGIQVASDYGHADSLLKNIKVYVGSTLLGTAASLVSNGSYYYQWILNISGFAIPANTTVPLRLVADIPASATNGSLRLGIAALNFNAPGALTTGFPIYGATMNLASGAANVSNLSWNITTPSVTTNGTLNKTSFSGSFTVSAGVSPVYVSSNPLTLTLSTNSSNVSSTITNILSANGVQSYDGSNYYQVTPGSSRTFNVYGILTNNANVAMSAGSGITAMYLYSNNTLSQAIPVTTNLQGLNSDFHIQVQLGASQIIHEQVVPVKTNSSAAYNSTATPAAKTADIWNAIGDWFSSLFQ